MLCSDMVIQFMSVKDPDKRLCWIFDTKYGFSSALKTSLAIRMHWSVKVVRNWIGK